MTEKWIGLNRYPAVGLLWALHCRQTGLAGVPRDGLAKGRFALDHPFGLAGRAEVLDEAPCAAERL